MLFLIGGGNLALYSTTITLGLIVFNLFKTYNSFPSISKDNKSINLLRFKDFYLHYNYK